MSSFPKNGPKDILQFLIALLPHCLPLTLGFALSSCWTHLVVLVAAAGDLAVQGDTDLIAHVLIQARVHLWGKRRPLEGGGRGGRETRGCHSPSHWYSPTNTIFRGHSQMNPIRRSLQ